MPKIACLDWGEIERLIEYYMRSQKIGYDELFGGYKNILIDRREDVIRPRNPKGWQTVTGRPGLVVSFQYSSAVL